MRPSQEDGWTTVAFGDVVQLSKTRSTDPEADGFERYVGLEHIGPGDLKIRRWGDIADGTTFTSVFKPGQVLFGKRRAYQRKVAVADFDGVCSGDIYVLEPKGDRPAAGTAAVHLPDRAFFDHAVGMSGRVSVTANQLEEPREVRVRAATARGAAADREGAAGGARQAHA